MRTSVRKLLHLLKPTTSIYPEKSHGDNEATPYQLNIEIAHKESTIHDNVTEFWFRSNKKINLIKVIVRIENDEDVIKGNLEIEYSNNDWHLLAGYEDVRAGDMWDFTFFYTITNQNAILTQDVKYSV
jgi:hypothetical protein